MFGVKPQVHGAAGWQMNEAALALEEELGFDYASDTRGEAPFVPLLSRGRSAARCPQLPTTLPTLDELIGVDGITVDNVHQALLERTRAAGAQPRVHAARRAGRHEAAAGVAAAAARLARAGLPAGVDAHAVRGLDVDAPAGADACSRARYRAAAALLAVQGPAGL